MRNRIIRKPRNRLKKHHISIIPLTPINHTCIINLQTNTLLEIEENPFLSTKQPNITIIPTLRKLEGRTSDRFMPVLWDPGGHTITYKKHHHCLCKRIQLYGKICN